MVEIIGLATMSALIWLITWSMKGESASEKRRIAMHPTVHQAGGQR
jgi:hypothetical protein